jgi:hypothetical protein
MADRTIEETQAYAEVTINAFYEGQLTAEECRQELEMPETAMRCYVLWLKALPGKPVFVGYPAEFDFLFVYWYLIRFAGESPFSFSALVSKPTQWPC